MPSVVDICNEAMDLLGAATITALTENSKEARLCNRRFSTVRDATLRSHSWNCAIARADLAADINTIGKKLFENAGASTDPGGYYYIAATFNATGGTGGDMSFIIEYVIN